MQKVNIGIVGTGWCGGIRAETCAASPYVSELHIAEIKEARLKEVAEKTKPATATTDYRQLLASDKINAIIVSATPETVHYPMAKETLLAGKHLLLEKPISLTLAEADELIALATGLQDARPGQTVVIVVGSSSHATHRVVGSVTVSLARHSPVPLIIVP